MRMKNDIDVRKGVMFKLVLGVLVFDLCLCRFVNVDMIVYCNIWIEKYLYECVEFFFFYYGFWDWL